MRDEFLAKLGLQTLAPQPSVLIPSISMFGVGMIVGASVGLMLAPKPGNQLRGDLERKVNKLWKRSRKEAEQALEKAEARVKRTTSEPTNGRGPHASGLSEVREA